MTEISNPEKQKKNRKEGKQEKKKKKKKMHKMKKQKVWRLIKVRRMNWNGNDSNTAPTPVDSGLLHCSTENHNMHGSKLRWEMIEMRLENNITQQQLVVQLINSLQIWHFPFGFNQYQR